MLHQRSEHARRRCGHGNGIRWRLFLRRLSLIVASLMALNIIGIPGLVFAPPMFVFGQTETVSGPSDSADTSTNQISSGEVQLRQSLQWLADLAIKKLPPSFKGDKGWGDEKKIWAGIDVKRDGLRLRTHRKYRHVSHGRWFRYEVTPKRLNDSRDGPANVDLTIHRVRKVGDRWMIDSTVVADADFTTQLQRWNLGLKLFSVSTRGRLQVRLDATMSVALTGDYSGTTPAFVLDPKVVDAKLILQKFDLDRVSHVGGEVAEEIGVVIERNLKRFWLDRLNEKLAGKLNRAIDKNRDDLRWSIPNVFSNWNSTP